MLRMFFMVVGLCVVSPLVSVGGLRRGAAVYPSDLYVDDGSAFLASLNVFEPITKALSTPLEQGIAVLWNELLLMNPHSLIRRHGSPFSRNPYSLGFYLGTRRSEVVSAVDLYVALLHKDGPAYRLMLSFVAGCLDGYSYASAVSVPLQFNSADEAVQAQFNAGLESHDPYLIHGNMCSVVESCDESVRLSLRSVAFVAGVHSAVHLQSARDAVFSTDFSIAARIEKIKSVIRLGVGADSLSDARGVGALSSPAGEATVHIPSAPPMTLEEAARHEAACARMSVCTKRDCLPVPEVRVASEERVPQEAQKLKQASGASGEGLSVDASVGREDSGVSGSSVASQSLAEGSVSQAAQKQLQKAPGGFGEDFVVPLSAADLGAKSKRDLYRDAIRRDLVEKCPHGRVRKFLYVLSKKKDLLSDSFHYWTKTGSYVVQPLPKPVVSLPEPSIKSRPRVPFSLDRTYGVSTDVVNVSIDRKQYVLVSVDGKIYYPATVRDENGIRVPATSVDHEKKNKSLRPLELNPYEKRSVFLKIVRAGFLYQTIIKGLSVVVGGEYISDPDNPEVEKNIKALKNAFCEVFEKVDSDVHLLDLDVEKIVKGLKTGMSKEDNVDLQKRLKQHRNLLVKQVRFAKGKAHKDICNQIERIDDYLLP